MKKNIVVLGLMNKNIGDTVILETCKYLISKINKDVTVSIYNLLPNEEVLKKYKIKERHSFFSKIIIYLKWLNPKIQEYYAEILKDADAVIFAGGGLIKFSREFCWNSLYSVIAYCEKKNIPVFLNAVGVEGYNNLDLYSQLIKKSLNKTCVKAITTRDDVETLKDYRKENISLAGDSALWTSDLYPIEMNNKNNIIGVGLLHKNIFKSYKVDFSEEKIIKTYCGIINELEKRGYKWRLFCNGLQSDYNMGVKVLQTIGKDISDTLLAPRPETKEDYFHLLTSFSSIIAGRLHANIIAASYNIPSIGLVWNNKLTLFGRSIGCENRFIKKENFFDSELIVNELEKAIKHGYNKETIQKLKNATVNTLSDFISAFV